MIRHKDHFHGSDLEKIEKIYSIKKEEIVSFSANVNPLGISPILKREIADHIDVISSYPDRDYTSLRKAIASYAKTRYENIIVGNGTTELISLFIQIIEPKRALILGPTYSEYERSVSLVNGQSIYYPLSEENDFVLDTEDFCKRLNDDIDLIILCNPNNPTSSCIKKEDMRRILDVCKEHAIYCLVDETYIEFVSDIDEYSAVKLCDSYNNVIVLRGTSKFFASPGLRLGYAITSNHDMISRISQYKNPWMINSLAEKCGQLMFSDMEYIKETKALITSEKIRLYEKLNASDTFKAFYPAANFMLLRILDDSQNAHTLFERCIKQKMMIRDCSTFPFLNDRFIRFCIMKREDNERLINTLLSN